MTQSVPQPPEKPDDTENPDDPGYLDRRAERMNVDDKTGVLIDVADLTPEERAALERIKARNNDTADE